MYIYTLDSHDCYGKFETKQQAMEFADKRKFPCYQILDTIPFISTVVLPPILKE